MLYPNQKRIAKSLLMLLYKFKEVKGRPITTSEAYKNLEKHFNLHKWELSLMNKDGSDKWKAHVRFAKQILVDKGLARIVKKGHWEITEKGEKYIKSRLKEHK